MSRDSNGFSLLEIIIVVIIITILAGIAFPVLVKSREGAMDKEAMASLKLIQAAEDSYYLEENAYLTTGGDCSTTPAAINTDLALRLSTTNWNYCIGGTSSDYFGYAQRTIAARGSVSFRVLRIKKDSMEACCGMLCADTTTKRCGS